MLWRRACPTRSNNRNRLGRVLADVVDVLRCPVCGQGVELSKSVRCRAGHSFDIARQGYVNLHAGSAPTTADTSAMVAARADFLAAGHYDVLAEVVADAAEAHLAAGRRPPPLIVDAGAGTGYWLATVLTRVGSARGLALDVSKYAMRRAAQAHPRIGAVVCDTWRRLPVADGSASLVLNVFAPRNAAEFARVLRGDGALLVVTPTREHLAEAVTALGLLAVDDEKDARLDRTLGGHFELAERDHVSAPLTFATDDLRRIASMGPSAWHVSDADLDVRLAGVRTLATTASVAISVYRQS